MGGLVVGLKIFFFLGPFSRQYTIVCKDWIVGKCGGNIRLSDEYNLVKKGPDSNEILQEM